MNQREITRLQEVKGSVLRAGNFNRSNTLPEGRSKRVYREGPMPQLRKRKAKDMPV